MGWKIYGVQIVVLATLLRVPSAAAAAQTATAEADAHLVIGGTADNAAKPAAVRPTSKENVVIFGEPGRYGGWPANHGLWQWGDELVAGFEVAWYKHATHDHAVDRSKPFENWQARSLDGGKTWKVENELPFTPLGHEKKPKPLAAPLDFTAPDFALMFRFGGLHDGPSWFYTSKDRCRTWDGPFLFALEGVDKICTRTDLIVLGPRDCLMFGSAAKKSDGKEGRVFCARTTDGGLNWKLVSFIGPEPEAGYAIMPSTVRMPSGVLVTAIRNGGAKRNAIDVWRSDDNGQHWAALGDATPDIGSNPPAMVLLKDGKLCLTYGYRRKPFGARARISSDEGRSWGPEIILRDDGLTGDLGYPRSLVRPDGKVFTVYYFNGPRDEDRTIQGTLWTPPAAAEADMNGATTNSVGMRLVHIAPGSFVMGQDGPASAYALFKHPETFDDADWDEKPAHRVTITRAYHMGSTEVTLGQYRQFRPEHLRGKEGDNSAVTAVSWQDAVAFCEWLSQKEGKLYRLPTEAEWEYACRAGTKTLFSTGDALPDGFQPWNADTGFRDRYFTRGELPKPYRYDGKVSVLVAQSLANPWGLYDMHGNVAEWCNDGYGPYEAGDQADPLGRSDGDFRVIRGGSHSAFARLLRSANRAAWLPRTKSDKVGFRVVLGELPSGTVLPPPLPPLNAQKVKQGFVKIEPGPQEAPLFSGPKPFVKIAPDSFGPLFSSHNHSPSLAECPNGDLLAVWYSCVDEGGSELCNVASRLRFGSTEWELASPFWDGADVNDHAPKVWWDGKQTLFNFARGREENIMRTSTDNGVTWSKASVVQPVGEFGNQPLQLSDGTFVLGNDSRQCSLVFSRDKGQTWDFNNVLKQASDFRPGGKGFRYPGIHAPMVQLADGRIMAMSRNDKPEDQATFGFKTPVSYSGDLGKTWTYEASEFPAISSVQRAAMIRLREGPILLCTFTDQWRDWKSRKGLSFKTAAGAEFAGYGLFAALSFDEGKTWPVRRLVTPGGRPRSVSMIDRGEFTLSDSMAEPCGYLAATQTRDGNVQLITSKNHYVFNLVWLRALPATPEIK
jgi:formylglycine-generating enzyme required for sulfatase activity